MTRRLAHPVPASALALTIALASFACGSGSSAGSSPIDAGSGDDGGSAGAGDDAADASDGAAGYPAAHPPMPQAVTSNGPVMTAPQVVAISFAGDSLQPDVDAFVTQLAGAAKYWSGATAEYGVGALTATTVHSTDTPAATLADADVQTWLTHQIQGGNAFPQPDGNTIYALFYPQGTNVTMGGGTSCQDFEGYHDDFTMGAAHVVYAVVARCPPPVQGLAEIDEVTAEASHEIIEAATDPFVSDQPAYATVDPDHRAWALLGGGGEIGDLCAPFPDAFYDTTGVDHLVQRVWSNAAAAAGHAPCEPDGTRPYFNSAPVEPDSITVSSAQTGTFTTKGVKIPLGQSKTIELDLYSDAPTSGPWKVSALDLTSAFFGGAPALSFSFDKAQGQNGDKLHLTIKALRAGALGAAPYWIQNDLGTRSTYWVGVVAN